MILKITILALIGLCAGTLSGMGLGAIILVPALTLILEIDQKVAQGINLMYFIPTAISALVIHKKNKNIDFSLSTPLIIWGIFGAIFGTMLSINLHVLVLRKIFAYFLFLIGIYQIYCAFKNKKQKK